MLVSINEEGNAHEKAKANMPKKIQGGCHAIIRGAFATTASIARLRVSRMA
jgi:hypothetical protein